MRMRIVLVLSIVAWLAVSSASSECISNPFGCVNPGAPCTAFGAPGVCVQSAFMCLCQQTGGGPGPQPPIQDWFASGGFQDDLGGPTNFNVEPAMGGPGEPGGPWGPEGLWGMLTTQPGALIGKRACITQTSSMKITHTYGASWGTIEPDVITMRDAQLCGEFTRLTAPGELGDDNDWVAFNVVSVRAEHPGFAPNGLLGIPTGRITTSLDRGVGGGGFLSIPKRPQDQAAIRFDVNVNVESTASRTLLPGFSALPMRVAAMGSLTSEPGGNAKATFFDHRVSSITPPDSLKPEPQR